MSVLLTQVPDLLAHHGVLLMALGIVFAFYMAWTIGANDVANAMGTSVGSGALTLKGAIIVAAILEFSGAFLVGQHVTEAIREEIIPWSAIESTPDLYVLGMLACLLATAAWLQFATYFGLPVSTTHTIVGAVIGFGLVGLADWRLIHWGKVGEIASSWVVTPILAGMIAFVIFNIIQRWIFYRKDLLGACSRVAPFFVFGVCFTIFLVTLWKGLKSLNLDLSAGPAMAWAAFLGAGVAVASMPLFRKMSAGNGGVDPDPSLQNPMVSDELDRMRERLNRVSAVATGETLLGIETLRGQVEELRRTVRPKTPEMRQVEKIFIYLQILSACAVAFAHGANDVANAVGPLSGIVSVLLSAEGTSGEALSPEWKMGILALGGLGIVAGLAMWGRRVIETVGRKITELTPTRGFAAQFGTAVTILLASRFKLPISTTHTLVGAVLGVGFARGMGAINLRVVMDIFASWLITLPAGMVLAIAFYFGLKAIFGV